MPMYSRHELKALSIVPKGEQRERKAMRADIVAALVAEETLVRAAHQEVVKAHEEKCKARAAEHQAIVNAHAIQVKALRELLKAFSEYFHWIKGDGEAEEIKIRFAKLKAAWMAYSGETE